MTETALKHCTFIVACREFFGLKEGQQLLDFAKEIRALTQEDKQDLILMFRNVGYDATKVS